MSFILKISIGFLVGILLGIVMMANTIKKNIKFLDNTALELIELLCFRYGKLLKLLNILKNYMTDEKQEIDSLISLIDSVLNKKYKGTELPEVISNENLINKNLEIIKQKMTNYSTIYENHDVESAINEIVDAEAQVGAGINIYNKLHSQINAFLETFPISVVASIIGKTMEHVPFVVNTVEEFGDNYIDEDEI